MSDDWDRDGPAIARNVARASRHARDAALQRARLTSGLVRQWHEMLMDGLVPTDPTERSMLEGVAWRGTFRGSAPELSFGVEIGGSEGVHPDDVSTEIDALLDRVNGLLAELDRRVPLAGATREQDRADIVALAAFCHSEWVRIHPFANGNGRSARVIVLFIAMRYGLPDFLPVRPRPRGAYEAAAFRSMQRDWKPTFELFASLLRGMGPGAGEA